jgi:hypothetical protein
MTKNMARTSRQTISMPCKGSIFPLQSWPSGRHVQGLVLRRPLRKRPARPEDQISAGTASTTTVPTTKVIISLAYMVPFLLRLAAHGEPVSLPCAVPSCRCAILNYTISCRTLAVIRRVA